MHKLYDTHFHLDLQKSKVDVLAEIEQNKIYTIAVTNLPPLYEKLKNEIDNKYVRVALGFHPELLNQYQKYIPQMWSLLSEAKYIGEVGIDLKTSKDSKKLQVSFFEELITRCNSYGNKVLTIHSRMAASEVVSIIGDKFNGKIILHWYSGSKKIQDIAINNGFYFSVNHAMFNSESGRKIIENTPNDKLLIETDSPFVEFKGVFINQFSQIQNTIMKLSELKRMNIDDLVNQLWSNFQSVITV